VLEYFETGSVHDTVRLHPEELNTQRIQSICVETAKGMSYLVLN
jgi:hypothetical protein